jgi:hypothetical protein
MFAAAIAMAQVGSPDAMEARLRKVLAGVPGVRFSHNEETLVVKYRTEVAKEPKQSKSFHKMTEQVSIERPTLTGFEVETYEFPHKPSEPARPMQAVRTNPNWIRDYGTWKVDATDRQVDGTDKGRYYRLEWGSNANPQVILRIRRALEKGTHALER